MSELELIIDFHKDAKRQGPGGEKETKRALELTGIDLKKELKIADIGCGSGAQTITLAENTNSQITAVDLFPEFLEKLNEKIAKLGLQTRVATLKASMEHLPFEKEAFDIIWSEGAIYNMGFENGVKEWRQFLKPNGYLVVSEISWLTDQRPKEVEQYWNQAYPEIDTFSNKIRVLGKNGFAPTAFFVLPQSCWIDNYYKPMQERIQQFLDNHGHSKSAKNFVAAERKEIEHYEKYKDFYSYGFYIARKL